LINSRTPDLTIAPRLSYFSQAVALQRPPSAKGFSTPEDLQVGDSAVSAGWELDPAKCTGCEDCAFICPVGAIALAGKVAVLADPAACCGQSCRICEFHCPEGAIRAF